MEQKIANIKDIIKDADMILVGIGKEFAPLFDGEGKTEELLPYLRSQYYDQIPQDHEVLQACNKLREILGVKPYFVVNMNTDDLIYRSAVEDDLIVSPCGSMRKMQCGEHIVEAAPIRDEILRTAESCEHGISAPSCPICGAPLQFHTIESDGYLESGYLPQWNKYQRWLSCTLNRKLCILELGVGFEYPQVVRWPFEKVAMYNRKAHLIRVGSRFPQIPDELGEKGISVKQAPIQFLLNY